MHISEPNRNGWLTTSLFHPLALLSTGGIDAKAVLQHVQHHNETHQRAQSDDRHVGKRSRHRLTDGVCTRLDLAVSSRETIAQTLACVVEQRCSTDTVVLAGDIATVVFSRLTVRSVPAHGTRADGCRRRCLIASAIVPARVRSARSMIELAVNATEARRTRADIGG